MTSDSEFALSDTIEGRWLQEEHEKFLVGKIYFESGLMKFGKNWKQVEDIVKTRKAPQIRSHAQKYFLKLNSVIKDRQKCRNSEK